LAAPCTGRVPPPLVPGTSRPRLSAYLVVSWGQSCQGLADVGRHANVAVPLPSLQAKALSVFMHNSGAIWDDIVAKVKRRATACGDGGIKPVALVMTCGPWWPSRSLPPRPSWSKGRGGRSGAGGDGLLNVAAIIIPDEGTEIAGRLLASSTNGSPNWESTRNKLFGTISARVGYPGGRGRAQRPRRQAKSPTDQRRESYKPAPMALARL
jgi:hypothetical protein